MIMWNNFGQPPNNNYEKFFNSFLEIDKVPVDAWKTKHFVGYVCKKYYDTYKHVFKLSCNTPAPSKCRELYEIKRIEYMLSSNPNIVKDYIDWVFETQIIKKKKRITSFRFLTTDESVTAYKMQILNSNNIPQNIERTTILPKYVQDILYNYGRKEMTFGQLAFLNQMRDIDNDVAVIMNCLSSSGFDLSILDKVY